MHTARLIGITQPSSEIFPHGITTAEEMIVYAARVSNPANQFNKETSKNLIAYLIKHNHWSPFEMASVQIEVKTTRDVAHQIIRHRSFSFQEYSQRYAKAPDDPYFRSSRLKDPINRQNSIDDAGTANDGRWLETQKGVHYHAAKAYELAIDQGVALEVARAVLPEGMTPTTIIMAGTVRSWLHYVQERMKKGSQTEHRQVAYECFKILYDEMPSIFPEELEELLDD